MPSTSLGEMYSSEAVLSDDVLDASDVDEALVLLALDAELLLEKEKITKSEFEALFEESETDA